MLKKSRNILLAISAVALAASAFVFGSMAANDPENGFLRRAYAAQDPISMGEIIFDESDSSTSGSTNSTTGHTQYGDTLICKVFNNSASASGHVGVVTSGAEIHFYESDGSTEYTFEDIEKISFYHNGKGLGFKLHYVYDNGTSDVGSYSEKTDNPRTINYHNYGNVSNLWVEITSSATCTLNKIVLTYNCTSKVQTGVEVSTAPTKTAYMVGQSFDPSGMLIKAVYDNGLKVATNQYTYYPTGALSVSDTYITISFGGLTVQQPITVTDAASHAVGTYKNSDYYIELQDGGTGTNYCGSDSCDLTWTFDGSSLKLYSTQTYSFVGSIFHTNTTVTAASITLNSSDDIATFRASVQRTFGPGTVTFTRQ